MSRIIQTVPIQRGILNMVGLSSAIETSVTQGTVPWVVAGDIKENETDTSNPVKIGGVYNSTPPTYGDGDRTSLQTTENGYLIVQLGNSELLFQGDVPAGDADSGNPVKIGAVYNASLPTYTSGNRVDLQANVNGKLLVNSESSVVVSTLWDNESTGTGGDSLTADTENGGIVTFFGHVSDATTLTVYNSMDNVVWYRDINSYTATGVDEICIHLTTGVRYVRLKSSNDVTATIYCSSKN